MEGARHWRCEIVEAQGEPEDSFGYAKRQDPQSLRQPLQYVSTLEGLRLEEEELC